MSSPDGTKAGSFFDLLASFGSRKQQSSMFRPDESGQLSSVQSRWPFCTPVVAFLWVLIDWSRKTTNDYIFVCLLASAEASGLYGLTNYDHYTLRC